MSRLFKQYNEKIRPEIMKKMMYTSVMQVPSLSKITLNMGVGDAVRDKKIIDGIVEQLTLLSGQKAVPTLARKSIAGFKLREGMAIGAKVTLRKRQMYEFLDRLINISLPRIRDFRGLKKRSFDGKGNYSFGIKEQIIFPEIDYDKVDRVRGLDVVITTTASSDEEARELLQSFNLPLIL
ncbi:MAG: 50S ribosomal protein L5 [Alphaproteobacteria bacterium]|nr:MAG: 50S ribosomal protein L5 [Alphaproteobacteria bacterium]